MNRLPVVIGVLAATLLWPGCYRGEPRRSALVPTKPVYGFALLNRTGGTIREPRLKWGSLALEFSTTVGPNSNVGQAYYTEPIPKSARMTWFDAMGQAHEASAPVVLQDGWPPSNGQICVVLLPEDKLSVEGVTAREDGEGYNLPAMHRVAANGGPGYIVATYNATAAPLSDLRVYFGDYRVNGEEKTDALGSDLNAGWRFAHGMPYSITDQARVTWSTQGKQHEASFDVKSQLPADLNGECIVFVIDDQPRVATVPWSARQRWWMDTRP